MKRLIVAILFSAALVFGISAQTPKAADAPTQSPTPLASPLAPGGSATTPTPEARPVALSQIQMQQLTIVQKDQAFAAEMMARAQAQQRALIAEFRWTLGVNPAEYEGDLQPLDQQGTVYGFVPKVKPQPPEQPKEAKPEPKQDGKQ